MTPLDSDVDVIASREAPLRVAVLVVTIEVVRYDDGGGGAVGRAVSPDRVWVLVRFTYPYTVVLKYELQV